MEELETAILCLKFRKTISLEDIETKQIKYFESETKEWLLQLTANEIPKI